MENQAMIKLQQLLDSSSTEEQKRIFYVLDYAANYFVGERRIPILSSQGFAKELQQLTNIEVIITSTEYWRSNPYERLLVNQEISNSIEKMLHEKYYPLFSDEAVAKKIQEIIRELPSSASTKMWSFIHEYKIADYSLSGTPAYIKEVETLAERLVAEGLSYVIGYNSSKWDYYQKEIIFRKQPVDVRDIFVNVAEEEIKKTLTSLSTNVKWCLYVRYVYPQADEKFLLKNATTSILPREIKQAFPNLPQIDLEKFEKNKDTLLAEQKRKQSKDLRSLINRDPSTIAVLETLFTFSHEEKNYRKINSEAMKKLLENIADAVTFNQYLSYLKESSLVFETTSEDIIIPNTVWDALNDEIKGNATEVKFFKGPLDAQAFLEETMSKAILSIKIWDPYVKKRTPAVLELAVKPGKVTIYILTSDYRAKEGIETLIKKGHKIRTKIIRGKLNNNQTPWHDRYLIIDNESVWHLGPSMDDAGIKLNEIAVLLSNHLGALIVDAFNFNLSKKNEDWAKDSYEVTEIPQEVTKNA